MRNLWLIIAREYLVRVRTRAFLIFTILMPLLIGGVVVLASMIAMHEPSTRRIANVASDARLAGSVRDELAAFYAQNGKQEHPASSTPYSSTAPAGQEARV